MSVAELNYYEILGVGRESTKVQICKAYKLLALQYHPDLKHENQNSAYKKFCLISEAFDILHDDQKRRVYDEHGEQKLKEGVVNENGERHLGEYTLTIEPEAVFEKFFGSRNIYEHLLSVGRGEGRSHPIFSSQYGSHASSSSKVPDLVVPVECRLSELYNGCKKYLTYEKRILSADGQNSITIEETKTIDIEPGRWSKNPIVFPGQGHQEPGEPPSNLVFSIVEMGEMNFRRSNKNPDDIIYTANISLMDALDSKAIQIKLLDGSIIQQHFDEIISPQTERNLAGRGMPRQNGNGKGDLLIRFNIEFPEQIDIDRKSKIVELLTSAV